MKKFLITLATVSLTSFMLLGAVHTPSENLVKTTTIKVAENGAFG
ncbi:MULTISPECIES: hypothetical protein [Bacillus]|nr:MULTISPECIES: hypothetical protein [Bacillus]MEC1454446.1 hypothetical protein [Bacillus haynesii]MEC1575579.1 hypothetical protein [Bacillus haynesii]MED4408299.1 hypothetical protein [Bacillus licheniformis]TWK94003.1 hypothetical protein CHCC20327_3690 [Bacillus licheniformis]